MIDIAINVALLAYNMWEAIFSIIGVAGTAYGLKEIWFNHKQQQSLKAKTGLSLFYLLHIAAIFFAAGILGEALLGATMSTLLVSSTSLINDTYDYFQECYQNYQFNQKVDKLQRKLSSKNIDFEQNSFFFEDIMDRQDEIECLRIQQDELVLLYSDIFIQNDCSQTHVGTIRNIAAQIKERCVSLIDENIVIGNFKKISRKRKLNEYQIVQKTNKEIKEINQQKMDFYNSAIHSKNGAPLTTSERLAQHKLVQREEKRLDTKIKKLAIINQHFYKIKKAKDAKIEVQNQLQALDEKYQQPPFDDYTLTEITALKALEVDYLQNRIRSLNTYIREKSQIGTQTNKVTSDNISLIGYSEIATLGPSPNKATLIANLENQMTRIHGLLQTKERQLAENERYLQLIAINPNEQLPSDLKNILKKAKKLIKYQNRLELAKVEKNQKLSATHYSLASIFIATVMCYSSLWIISDIFTALMRFVGVMAGVTSIRSFINTRRTQQKIQCDKSKQFNNVIDDCKNRAKDIRVPQVQANVKEKVFSIIEELEKEIAHKRSPNIAGLHEESFKRFLPNFQTSTKRAKRQPAKSQKMAPEKAIPPKKRAS